VGQLRALDPESYNLQEAKQPVLHRDSEAQHEALKDTLREKKKAISNIYCCQRQSSHFATQQPTMHWKRLR
jgi:hypothetical protein